MNAKLDKRTRYVRIAAIVSVFGNLCLSVLKIVTGLMSKSNALLADGIDSASDVLISSITLVIVAIISKPADKQHPWGHRRAETLATVFLAFIIFFMGAQLILNSVSKLIEGEVGALPSSVALIVTIVSIVGKLLLTANQYLLGKRANSTMIKANAKNMAGDVLISVGVLLGLTISHFTKSPLADTIITIIIGLWIIKNAIGIFRETNSELMDGSHNTAAYSIIVEAVDCIDGASNPHRARMRRIAGFWDISFDINVNEKLSVLEAHSIATEVENEIKKRLDNVFDIMVHVEPCGDKAVEAFGLSEEDMRSEDEYQEI